MPVIPKVEPIGVARPSVPLYHSLQTVMCSGSLGAAFSKPKLPLHAAVRQ